MVKYDLKDYKQAKYLIKTYGDRAFDVVKLAKSESNLFEPLHP